ncbi:hypothetical protein D3875_13120 [Deinococcus cavernae]|uniref:Uncharacterized protein n=1 Tax=Deinococcus cavernae TaxID=2320857 RepID=A0A418V8E3_9DEIO|nr:hypothetical protein [Deinococcus cavernae]RJF72349.1 hypothetical protein D3875_13120 [Deinococcus cavernae]
MRKFLLLAVLTAAPASAQTLSVNIDASVQFPPVVQSAANLVNLLSQGVQVSFLTPTAQPAATLNQTGGIRITGVSPQAAPLTQVQVATPIPGTTQYVKEIYPLAQPLNTAQPLAAQSIVVKAADGQKVPLVNVMGRQAAWAKAPGLQKKLGGMPPGQLKQLCKKEPRNALCRQQPDPHQNHGKGKGKH